MSPKERAFSGMLCCTAEAGVGPAPRWWAPCGHSPSPPPWGANYPRRGTAWSSPASARDRQLHGLIPAGAAEKLPALQMQFRWVGDAVISQLCGLYSSLEALNIQFLEVKSFFFI